MQRICVFCGSKTGNDEAFQNHAADLGRCLAANGLELVFGGGSVGLMGVVADAVLDVGGQVIGVIPELLATVMRLPDTIHTEKAALEDEEWQAVREGLQQALLQLNAFRFHEGEAMDKDLRQRVEVISRKLKDVDALEGGRLEGIRERIGNNLAQYLKKEDL